LSRFASGRVPDAIFASFASTPARNQLDGVARTENERAPAAAEAIS
jgi:hypothetical protein